MASKGDCFFGDPSGRGNPHYWLVLCGPTSTGGVALVSFTTPKPANFKFNHLVSTDRFFFLHHTSRVAWELALYVSTEKLGKFVLMGSMSHVGNSSSGDVDRLIAEGDGKILIQKDLRRILGIHE